MSPLKKIYPAGDSKGHGARYIFIDGRCEISQTANTNNISAIRIMTTELTVV